MVICGYSFVVIGLIMLLIVCDYSALK